MGRPDWAPAGIDLDRPSAARVYDFYLGGFHNFAADREMGRRAIEMWPELPEIMKANRAFLRRAVRHLVAAGVRQFLDIGSGIPTVGNVHEVARAAAPDARVVYVDNDPVAVEHSRAILTGSEQTAVVQADLREPDSVLRDPAAKALLDLRQPVAVLMVAVLHFVSDEDDPHGLVRRYRDAAPAGSYLAVSHASSEGQPALTESHRGLYRRTATPAIWTHLTVSLIRGDDGAPRYQVAIIEDVTERHRLQDRLSYQANHDPLTGLPNRAMFLDRLTAALMASDADEPLAAVRRLADMGVRIAIDDFGTGYSNLAYLRRLPVHELKLAGAFLDGLRTPGEPDPTDIRVVAALVEIAHTLRLTVTAEAVETPEQADRLRELGCDTAQGWYFARPAAPDRLGARWRTDPARSVPLG